MNNPHIEKAEGHMYYAQHEQRGLTERQIDAALAQAEATLAIVYELQQSRQQAVQGSPQTGAAFPVPGVLVTVNNPSHEWYGATGRVIDVSATHTNISLPGHTRWIQTNHLEKADDK